jgi:HTH-type transcriptional regulator / antitoxin HigA
METMNALATSPVYARLLARIPPKVIRTEAENEHYIDALYALQQKRSLTREEKELADLLTLLIENFEEKRYQLPRVTPRQALSFLMEQHALKQKDLLDIFGTRSVVAEVVNGKRELTKEQIRRLSQRFQVSPELFF